MVSPGRLGADELAKRTAVADSWLDCRSHGGYDPRRPRPPSSGTPQHFSWTGCTGGRSRRHHPLLCVGARYFGDSSGPATSGVWHSRPLVRPASQSAGLLAVLARPHSGGGCHSLILRWLDAPGSYRNRRGLADWNWSLWLRDDVGEHSLHRIRCFLLSRRTRTIFSRSLALSPFGSSKPHDATRASRPAHRIGDQPCNISVH